MPRFYRVMLADGDRPKIGDKKSMLGVRVGPPPADIEPDEPGRVRPGMGGMSVASHWKALPHFLIPPRLASLLPTLTKRRAATGNDDARCWRMGEGDFVAGQVTPALRLRVDSETHGLVEPATEMPLSQFQQALADTRDGWIIDEE